MTDEDIRQLVDRMPLEEAMELGARPDTDGHGNYWLKFYPHHPIASEVTTPEEDEQ
jgi:hypothetical protein